MHKCILLGHWSLFTVQRSMLIKLLLLKTALSTHDATQAKNIINQNSMFSLSTLYVEDFQGANDI